MSGDFSAMENWRARKPNWHYQLKEYKKWYNWVKKVIKQYNAAKDQQILKILTLWYG